MAKARKDNKGRALRKGEIQRSQDNRYVYTYTNPVGKRAYVYANTLQELREKEDNLIRDQLDGLDTYVAGRADLDFLVDRYLKTKNNLASSTYANYRYTYDHFCSGGFGKKKICDIKYSDVLHFYLLLLDKDAFGMLHEDRLRPLAAALTNLVLNLILVQFIGIYGILLSTVLAILCVGMPWLLHNLFTIIFEKKHMWHFIGRLAKYTFVVFISCVVTYFICSRFNMSPVPTILIRGVICLIVPNLIYYLAFRKTKEFQQSLQLVDKMTKGTMSKVLVK